MSSKVACIHHHTIPAGNNNMFSLAPAASYLDNLPHGPTAFHTTCYKRTVPLNVCSYFERPPNRTAIGELPDISTVITIHFLSRRKPVPSISITKWRAAFRIAFTPTLVRLWTFLCRLKGKPLRCNEATNARRNKQTNPFPRGVLCTRQLHTQRKHIQTA